MSEYLSETMWKLQELVGPVGNLADKLSRIPRHQEI